MPTLRRIVALLLLAAPTFSTIAVASPLVEEITDAHTIDANHASPDELQALKGVGPRKAAAIVKERQQHGAFIDARDLTRVKGIGQKLADTLEQRLSFRRP